MLLLTLERDNKKVLCIQDIKTVVWSRLSFARQRLSIFVIVHCNFCALSLVRRAGEETG